jgi:hypothetical protein
VHAPSARAICARLADREGKPFPWRALLELVFDSSRDIAQTHALRHRQAEADHSTEQHLYYALRRLASELGTPAPGPDAYARKRQQLIRNDRRRGVDLLEELLPTVGQVERIAGSWERGLPSLSSARAPATPPVGHRAGGTTGRSSVASTRSDATSASYPQAVRDQKGLPRLGERT